MHRVRIYLNAQEGTMWWAEDELGFAGGADRLTDLIEMINEWAECEGVLDDLAFDLVGDPPAAPIATPFSVTGLHSPRSAGDSGVRAVSPARIAV